MKKSISPAIVWTILGVVLLVVAAVGFFSTGGTVGRQPEVEPREFTPPASYQAPGQGGSRPIGAPELPAESPE